MPFRTPFQTIIPTILSFSLLWVSNSHCSIFSVYWCIFRTLVCLFVCLFVCFVFVLFCFVFCLFVDFCVLCFDLLFVVVPFLLFIVLSISPNTVSNYSPFGYLQAFLDLNSKEFNPKPVVEGRVYFLLTNKNERIQFPLDTERI